MSRHATTERLSAYLDDELGRGASRVLAGHLEGCPHCRQRLAALRRVVGSLRGLERAAPPPYAAPVEGRNGLATRLAGRRGRFEARPFALPQLSPVFLSVALVIGVGGVSLFAHGIEASTRPWTDEVLVTATEISGDVQDTREVAGRTFDLVDGVWQERGLEEGADALLIEADSEVGQAVFARHPELAGLGGRILLRADGPAVELLRAAEAAPSSPATEETSPP